VTTCSELIRLTLTCDNLLRVDKTYSDLNVVQEGERVDKLDGSGGGDLEFELSVL
jgi:hypothetical protein